MRVEHKVEREVIEWRGVESWWIVEWWIRLRKVDMRWRSLWWIAFDELREFGFILYVEE